MDDFEQFLKNQPMRATPPEWRGEILAAAAKAAPRKPASSAWQAWLWPSPYAWGALAAVWAVIFTLNFAADAAAERTGPHGPPPSQQEIFAMFSEQREVEEFLSAAKPTPGPVSAAKEPTSPGAWLESRKKGLDQLA